MRGGAVKPNKYNWLQFSRGCQAKVLQLITVFKWGSSQRNTIYYNFLFHMETKNLTNSEKNGCVLFYEQTKLNLVEYPLMQGHKNNFVCFNNTG